MYFRDLWYLGIALWSFWMTYSLLDFSGKHRDHGRCPCVHGTQAFCSRFERVWRRTKCWRTGEQTHNSTKMNLVAGTAVQKQHAMLNKMKRHLISSFLTSHCCTARRPLCSHRGPASSPFLCDRDPSAMQWWFFRGYLCCGATYIDYCWCTQKVSLFASSQTWRKTRAPHSKAQIWNVYFLWALQSVGICHFGWVDLR